MTPDEAAAAEREAFAAIGALGRREVDAVKAWIASGCEGPNPEPDHAERARLDEQLRRALAGRLPRIGEPRKSMGWLRRFAISN